MSDHAADVQAFNREAANYDAANNQESSSYSSDSKVDAICALATVVIFVTTVLFWISNQ